jgi:two-component system chemotaxis response regulator CheY
MDIKALIADSSTKTRKNITRSLNEIGVRNVVEATDGAKAIELLQTGKFDVVFAAYNSQTGKLDELVTAARKTNAKLPVIITAPPSKQMDEMKKTCPTATTYLTMPFSTDQLRKTIDQYVPSIAG